ncbi:MBG domain-containing protein [Flavobacterium sp. NG2]|uniref:DUF7507 domain-containing protein n=1 Tax=Flavobacterium sp. NG2 TaxID=3097547 RepID=UPI002A7F3C52|nr:MBG domain-containing protein [Flavobacterium sp. NG2]WPR70461.1 MBG domain-containing protein [Flavobacterium sp. NG2]
MTLGNNPNYIVNKVDGTLTVTPKELNVVVTADDKTKVYGDENPALTAVVTGAVNNDVINYSLATTATQFSPVDTYPIVVTLGNNPNYIVNKVDGNLTVTPKELNVVVTADDKTKVYGDVNPALTAVVTGAVNNDVINYSLATTATQFSPVDTYPIVVTLGNNPNYIVNKVDGTLTITPKAIGVTVVADNKTKVYGEVNPPLTAVVSGAVAGGDTINYTLATPATQFSNVGNYPIEVILGDNPNYIVTKTDAIFTITKLDIVAKDDLISEINGTTGNSNVGNVLSDNGNGSDTLGSNPAVIDTVNISIIAEAVSINNGPVPSINTTNGQISVPSGTPAGNYTIEYKICEIINSENCDDAIVTITVYNPSIAITKDGAYFDANNDGITNVGDKIIYSFVVTNTGSSIIRNISITDNNVQVIGGPIDLGIGESDERSFSAEYLINQEDINRGFVYNLALAKGNPPTGNEVEATSTDPTPCTSCPKDPECTNCTITVLNQSPSISITKDGTYVDTNNDGKTNVGDIISYKFVVTNTGNLPLTNVTVTDTNAVVSGGPIATLAVGVSDTTTFSAVHAITQADIDKGIVYNLALATGTPPKGEPITATSTDPTPCTSCPKDPDCLDCTITLLNQDPKVVVTLDGTFVDANNNGIADVGEVVNYKIIVVNEGNVTLTDVTVSQTFPQLTISGSIPTLEVNASNSTSITGSHILTQTDIDAGYVYTQVTTQGTPPQGEVVTDASSDPTPCASCPVNPDCVNCTITPVPQKAELVVVKKSNTPAYSSVGDIINYTIQVQNTGNVTLFNIKVTDPLTGLNQVIATLEPGTYQEYNENYTVKQEDRVNLSVTNVAFADGFTPNQTPISASDSEVVEANIVLGCGSITVHNAFSPNGDGINETFIIDNIDDVLCYPTNSVEIYNRWGVLVFETSGYDNVTKAFKGISEGRTTISQSSRLPAGTYFYILHYTSIDGLNNSTNNTKDGYLYLTR